MAETRSGKNMLEPTQKGTRDVFFLRVRPIAERCFRAHLRSFNAWASGGVNAKNQRPKSLINIKRKKINQKSSFPDDHITFFFLCLFPIFRGSTFRSPPPPHHTFQPSPRRRLNAPPRQVERGIKIYLCGRGPTCRPVYLPAAPWKWPDRLHTR